MMGVRSWELGVAARARLYFPTVCGCALLGKADGLARSRQDSATSSETRQGVRNRGLQVGGSIVYFLGDKGVAC
ncbi:hypothetical protein C7B77_16775 [Chamaesiphon polymorphus CCALA 037]|uniref:Uncharacterized protein n=1 Tax=Chamaesiphon polymorphus CCALA 037 TaxID=2107692 RepID=A0A2T1GC48_9CYAN|nr:hypothetical protein C7B77_16775 [Chamaesiphon polymorphus CCALA 037]